MFEEKGSLSEVPAIRIVLSIFENESTGILYLKKEDALKVLYMSRGKLVWAMSNSPQDKLEDILIAKGHIDAASIENVRSEGSISSSIGKLLVEKGHLTLEQLIDATKIQVGRIVKSVLSWDQGGYQFVKEPPPERVFNLDINLMNFIFNFVLKELDMTLAWREIRTVRVHLAKTADQEKIDKYNLTEREQNFLDNFSEGTSIESVLSRYAGSHRDTLLRFVYFFLSSGLLDKLDIEDEVAEEETGDDAPPEEIGSLDSILLDEQPAAANLESEEDEQDVEIITKPEIPGSPKESVEIERLLEGGNEADESREGEDIGDINLDEPKSIEPEVENKGIDLIARTPESEEPEGINMGDGVASTEESGQYVFDDQQVAGMAVPEDFDEDELETPPHPVPDKKKLKQFHYLILLVILILIIGGVIFLLLPEEDLDLNGTFNTPSQTNSTKKVINITERKPVVQKKKSVPKQIESSKPENKKVSPKKETNTVRKESSKKLPTATDISSIFQRGSYQKAGELWRIEAIDRGVKYAILLELDCQKQSVLNAFKECNKSSSFYIINIRRKDRNCFLVLWGRYFSESEANAALGLIPRYFIQQTPPARVIELQKYL